MSSSANPQEPAAHRALLLKSTRDPFDISVVEVKTPEVGAGAALIRVLAVPILTYAGKVYSGKKLYGYPEPFVPGSSAIGRISIIGPDATLLRPGQLVFFDCFIQGRDSDSSLVLSGLSSGFNSQSNALMEGEWRNSTFAEFAKVPLENCFPLDEGRLLGSPSDGGLGYSIGDLAYLFFTSVPFGGLRSVDLKAGEKVIITPATGSFGSAAVKAALAMGAQVIAMGRNKDSLAKLKQLEGSERIRIVVNTSDVEADTKELTKDGPADVFYDISPGKARSSSHFKSCIMALGRGGRVSFMSAYDELSLPLMHMVIQNITLKGLWMYEKEDIRHMIKLLEAGYLRVGNQSGVRTVGTYSLDEFEGAFEAASQQNGPFLQTVMMP